MYSLLVYITNSFFLTIIFTKLLITFFKRKNIYQSIRENGPSSHLAKKGTPTMGGVAIILAITITNLLLQPSTFLNYFLLAALVCFSLIGAIDDILKVFYKNSKGISARTKYCLQTIFALSLILALDCHTSIFGSGHSEILFIKSFYIPTWLKYILAYFVIVGSSNATNITDGLDGLAISLINIISLGFFIICTSPFIAKFLTFAEIKTIEKIILSIIGAGFGFYLFNRYPAKIIMGDVGSLSLGALLGCIAIILRAELVFFIMALVLVCETISVMLQVIYYKKYKRRLF